MAGILFIISAPSGSGKSTLVDRLRSLVPGLEFSISYTTRPPRGSEQNGREYHFISREEFETKIARGDFLEYAEVFGDYKGTAWKPLDDAKTQGKDLLLDIDIQGTAQVRKRFPEAVTIFVMPPDRETLETRLRTRSRAEGSVSAEVIERRLAKARLEIEKCREYGYILVNDVLDRAVEELSAIVVSERVKRGDGKVDADTARLMALAEGCLEKHSGDRLRPVLASFGLLDSAGAHTQR